MRRLMMMLTILSIAGCRSADADPSPSMVPSSPEPPTAIRVNAPGVNVLVREDGGVSVFDPSGRSRVPTVVVPGQ